MRSLKSLKPLYLRFGFSGQPFNLTPDTRFFFPNQQYIAASKHLQYGLSTEGFTILTGEVGLGKTLLCRHLLRSAGKHVKTVYIFNSFMNLPDLLKSIYYDLTGLHLAGNTYSKCMNKIAQALTGLAKEGKKVAVLIDEAQCLEPKVLRALNHLSNFETQNQKPLSFIMVGQPELANRIAKSNLGGLLRDTRVSFILRPLRFLETRDYINHRMILATANDMRIETPRFCEHAICLAHLYSRGVPRRINQICGRALLAAFIARKKKIGARLILRAVREILG